MPSRNETPMGTPLPEPFLREMESRLAGERTELQSTIAALAVAERTLAESQGDESGPGGQMADVASDLTESEMDLSLAGFERTHLAEVEEALDRIKEGRYGLCAECGTPISMERLTALPWTSRCIGCATEHQGS